MVFPHFRRDAQFRAQESGSQFSNEFFARVAVIAETLGAEVPIKTVLGFRPVDCLVFSIYGHFPKLDVNAHFFDRQTKVRKDLDFGSGSLQTTSARGTLFAHRG
jgi:hypothetical protein